MDNDAAPAGATAETRRVTTTLPLQIGTGTYPIGHELDLPAADAQAMVDAGRALFVGEPLKLTDEERAALPPLGHVDPDAPMEAVTGYAAPGAAPSHDPEPHAPDAPAEQPQEG